jgi:WD40 repeat protein
MANERVSEQEPTVEQTSLYPRTIVPVCAFVLLFTPSGCDRTSMEGTLDEESGSGGPLSPAVATNEGAGGVAGSGGFGGGGPSRVTFPVLTEGGAGGSSTGLVGIGGTGGQPGPSVAQPDCSSISTKPGVVNPCGHTFGVAYSPDGTLLAASFESANPSVRIWRLADGKPLPDPEGQGRETTYDVAFSPDGKMLAAAGYRHEQSSGGSSLDDQPFVRIWDVSSGALLRSLVPNCGWYADSVEFSPDGDLLLTGGATDEVQVWRVADWMVWLGFPVPTTSHNAHFSPDGTRIVVAQYDGEAWVYGIPPSSFLLGPIAIASEMADAEFSPDGTLLATTWQSSTSSKDNSVRIYDATDGTLLQTLSGHSMYISHVVWVDQDRIVSGDWGGTVILWQRDAAGTFSFGRSMSTGGQSVGLAVSPDKKQIVTGGGYNGYGFVFLEL